MKTTWWIFQLKSGEVFIGCKQEPNQYKQNDKYPIKVFGNVGKNRASDIQSAIGPLTYDAIKQLHKQFDEVERIYS